MVVPDRCNSQTSCIDTVFRTLQSQVLGQDITRRTSRFFVRHPPPPRLPDVMHVTLSPRTSPSIFAYCMLSNQKLEVKRPGNEAIYSTTISQGSLLKPRTGWNNGGTFRPIPPLKYGTVHWIKVAHKMKETVKTHWGCSFKSMESGAIPMVA